MSYDAKYYLIEYFEDGEWMSQCSTILAEDAQEAASIFKINNPNCRIRQVALVVPESQWSGKQPEDA